MRRVQIKILIFFSPETYTKKRTSHVLKKKTNLKLNQFNITNQTNGFNN